MRTNVAFSTRKQTGYLQAWCWHLPLHSYREAASPPVAVISDATLTRQLISTIHALTRTDAVSKLTEFILGELAGNRNSRSSPPAAPHSWATRPYHHALSITDSSAGGSGSGSASPAHRSHSLKGVLDLQRCLRTTTRSCAGSAAVPAEAQRSGASNNNAFKRVIGRGAPVPGAAAALWGNVVRLETGARSTPLHFLRCGRSVRTTLAISLAIHTGSLSLPARFVRQALRLVLATPQDIVIAFFTCPHPSPQTPDRAHLGTHGSLVKRDSYPTPVR
ncbi:hypothetical protein C8J57DRAFT_1720527 [Mycena rebaudengoi]|nr:hypothetical protein C8J57DRAFT_1720527 [Mycena rebaudengoi]